MVRSRSGSCKDASASAMGAQAGNISWRPNISRLQHVVGAAVSQSWRASCTGPLKQTAPAKSPEL